MLDTSKLLGLIMSMLSQQTPAQQKISAPDNSQVRETAEEIIIALEVPGIQSREDIYFSIGVNSLTIKGLKKKTAGAHLSGSGEITQEKFERTFKLPYPVRPETATAFYSKGILELKLKKLPEKTWDKVYIQFL
jgi:HSP20 family molecular chaperone IbpA